MGKFDKLQRDVDEIYKESPRPWQQVTIAKGAYEELGTLSCIMRSKAVQVVNTISIKAGMFLRSRLRALKCTYWLIRVLF